MNGRCTCHMPVWVKNPMYHAADCGRFKPGCAYCGTTDGLRVKCAGGGYIAPEYTCEWCFTGTDTGPCFDDLPAILQTRAA